MFRNVRTSDLVLLWAKAAGMCSHPDCRVRLVVEAAENDDAAAVGEAAHIVARSEGGPRGDGSVSPFRLNGYDNLILLCGHHHTLIDRQAGRYTVAQLRGWKAEHEAWVRAVTEGAPREAPWVAIVQDPQGRMDLEEATAALGAGNCVARLCELRGTAEEERRAAEELLAATPPEQRRFAVFSLGSIPNAVQLGFVLGDRARVKLFQYHRDRGTWAWPEDGGAASEELKVTARGPGGTPGGRRGGGEAVVRVSLSAAVPRQEVPGAEVDIEIAVGRPSVRWLRHTAQLTRVAEAYGRALEQIDAKCRRVHLFYAGPTPGAVAFGRAYNPRMYPELVVYEYERPEYRVAVRLGGEGGPSRCE